MSNLQIQDYFKSGGDRFTKKDLEKIDKIRDEINKFKDQKSQIKYIKDRRNNIANVNEDYRLFKIPIGAKILDDEQASNKENRYASRKQTIVNDINRSNDKLKLSVAFKKLVNVLKSAIKFVRKAIMFIQAFWLPILITSFIVFVIVPAIIIGVGTVQSLGQSPFGLCKNVTEVNLGEQATASAAKVDPSSNMLKIVDVMMGKNDKAQVHGGFDLKFVAAILGNIHAESGLDPDANNAGKGKPPQPDKAYGIAQWMGGRQQNMLKFVANSPDKADKLIAQTGYLMTEMISEINSMGYSGVYQKYKDNVEALSVIVTAAYERPFTTSDTHKKVIEALNLGDVNGAIRIVDQAAKASNNGAHTATDRKNKAIGILQTLTSKGYSEKEYKPATGYESVKAIVNNGVAGNASDSVGSMSDVACSKIFSGDKNIENALQLMMFIIPGATDTGLPNDFKGDFCGGDPNCGIGDFNKINWYFYHAYHIEVFMGRENKNYADAGGFLHTVFVKSRVDENFPEETDDIPNYLMGDSNTTWGYVGSPDTMKRSDLKPGDIIFSTDQNGHAHVMIYAGNELIKSKFASSKADSIESDRGRYLPEANNVLDAYWKDKTSNVYRFRISGANNTTDSDFDKMTDNGDSIDTNTTGHKYSGNTGHSKLKDHKKSNDQGIIINMPKGTYNGVKSLAEFEKDLSPLIVNDQCVMLVHAFVQKYANAKVSVKGNGADGWNTARKFAADNGLPLATNMNQLDLPIIYSIRKGDRLQNANGGGWTSDKSYGHTGIIIAKEGDIVTVLEGGSGFRPNPKINKYKLTTAFYEFVSLAPIMKK